MDISHFTLYYAPIDNVARTLLTEVSKNLSLSGDTQGFDDESDLLQHFNRNESLAAIIFQTLTTDSLSVTIRFPNEFRTVLKRQDRWWSTGFTTLIPDNNNLQNPYIREGFLQIQHAVFKAWIKYCDASLFHKIPIIDVNYFLHDSVRRIPIHRTNSVNVLWHLYHFLYFVPFLNLIWVSSLFYILHSNMHVCYLNFRRFLESTKNISLHNILSMDYLVVSNGLAILLCHFCISLY